MQLLDLDGLLPGEVGWVCACGAAHALVKGAWNVAEDVCEKRLPAFRMHPAHTGEKIQLIADLAAA